MNRPSAQVETRMVIPQKVASRGVPAGFANVLNPVLREDVGGFFVPQTSQSAVSRVSKPAGRPPNWRARSTLPATSGCAGLNLLLAVLLAGAGGGCESAREASFTCKLWDKDVRSYCQPVANPELALYEAKPAREVLVEYNALSDRDDQVKRRAYFLEANQTRIAAGKAPQFVDPRLARNLTAIPQQVSTNTYAIPGTNGWTFTLYRPGREPEMCNLPTYRDDHNTAGRVALTPLAVAGDATIIGVVAAVILGYAYADNPANYR